MVGGTYLTLDVKVVKAVENDLWMRCLALPSLKKKASRVPGASKLDDKNWDCLVLNLQRSDRSYDNFCIVSQGTKSNSRRANLVFAYVSSQISELEHEAVEGNINILRTRLDAFGAGEVGIVPQGEQKNRY